MRYARNEIVSPSEAGYYHCVSRCVRRAFLCGMDALTGRSFDHRRQWIEDRLLMLADVFAVDICAYAVMSNHVHVVIHVDPATTQIWSPEEVASRWVALFPARRFGRPDDVANRAKKLSIAADPQLIATYRERLSSLSWFMRCLNEPIARMANREDSCTGRFWEGRFKCQVLLDDRAVLACMAYVDLNPVRAGIAVDLESSRHTSIRRRLQNGPCDSDALRPVAGTVCSRLSLSSRDYVSLVDWAGRRLHPGKCGRIASEPPEWLRNNEDNGSDWLTQVSSIETHYWRVVGGTESLLQKAIELGKRWLKGIRSAPVARTSWTTELKAADQLAVTAN